MIDKWLIVGGAHFAVAAVVLKLLGIVLPCSVTCYYSYVAHFLLYVFLTRFAFELTKKFHLSERLQPENRAVFITGCDTGYGLSLAKRLDVIGFPVFAGCLDPKSSGARALKRESSKRLQLVEVDVSNDNSVKTAAEFIQNNLGTSELWAVVNNAEIQKGFEVELTSMKDFKDTMEVNAFGPVRVTKSLLPLLRQSRGRVINVTNPSGRLALPYLTPYTMSKFAVKAFSECMKHELDVWGIRVISVEPVFSQDGLADPELVRKNLDATFSNIEPNVKDDYGEKYLKNFKTFVDFMCSASPRNVDAVIDALDDAVSLKYPSSVYKPSRNFLFQVSIYFLERGPPILTHFLVKILLYVSGLPRPREAENYL